MITGLRTIPPFFVPPETDIDQLEAVAISFRVSRREGILYNVNNVTYKKIAVFLRPACHCFTASMVAFLILSFASVHESYANTNPSFL